MSEPKSDAYVVTMVPIEDEVYQELRVTRNGKVVRSETDGGEPEDNLFYRDWKWVAEALREAYAFGLEDGRRTATELPGEGEKP
jgi:hypothetical protein